jgi:pyruvate/2-oxoglutarate dehydrogenase complex dihydrolipoamide acyltransferase (E2) component
MINSARFPEIGPEGVCVMPAGGESYQVRPFLKIRRAYIHNFEAARRKNFIHGLVEVDVTEVRRAVRDLETAGKDISFTAVVMHAVARAVDKDRIMHAYRRHNQLILFDDVDVNTQIEVVEAGQKIVKPLLVRAANRKSIEELTKEIRAGQEPDPGAERRYRATLALLSMPRPLRSMAWRAAMSSPTLFKRMGGTVGLSSVGMFGAGGGRGIPIAPPTLMITVGGIAMKPRYVDDHLEPRELLDITISVDHAVVDGATAARFSRRLSRFLEDPVDLGEHLPQGDAGVGSAHKRQDAHP